MRRTVFLATVGGWLLAGGTAALAKDGLLLAGPDGMAMSDTVHHALEYNPSNQAAEWVNPDTGRSGAVIPVKTFETAQGQPCREFIAQITIGGRQEQGYGTACRQPDGSWQIVSDVQQPTSGPPPAPRTKVYCYPPPVRYYSYPTDFYGPSRIFLSFSFVHRDGYLHRGHYYRGGWSFRHRHPRYVRETVFVGPRIHHRYTWPRASGYRDRRGRGHTQAHWSKPGRQWHPRTFRRR